MNQFYLLNREYRLVKLFTDVTGEIQAYRSGDASLCIVEAIDSGSEEDRAKGPNRGMTMETKQKHWEIEGSIL